MPLFIRFILIVQHSGNSNSRSCRFLYYDTRELHPTGRCQVVQNAVSAIRETAYTYPQRGQEGHEVNPHP